MFKGLKSLLAGLLAGTAVGMLFATKKGKEFREEIKEEINRGGSGLGTIKETFVGMGKEIKTTCKECYKDVNDSEKVQKGKEKVKEFAKKTYEENVPKKTREKAKKFLKKAKSKAKDAINKIK